MTRADAGSPSIAKAAALVAVIAVVGIAANVLTPEGARVPVKVAALAALVVVVRRAFRLSWDELGMAPSRLGAGLRLGGLAAALVAVAVAVLVAIPATRSFFESAEVANDSFTEHWLMPLVIIPIGTALFEEILFRGVLLGVFLRMTTTGRAIAISSVLFGLWHLHPALSDARGESALAALGIVVGTVAITTVAGVMFALLRCRSGSIAAPTLAHAAVNSFAYVGALFASH